MTAIEEEELRPRAVQNGMSQAEYDTWMWISKRGFEAGDKPYTFVIPQSEVTKLLATLSQQHERELARHRKDAAQQAYYVAHDVLADLKIPRKDALEHFKSELQQQSNGGKK